MRLLIADDEPPAIERLQVLLKALPQVTVVGSASNGLLAAEAIERLQPDVVLLDIQMPGKSGMAVAADLHPGARPEIIFVTAFEHFAPDAFDVEAADYLLKPVRFDRLRQAIDRAARRRQERGALAALSEAARIETPDPTTEAIWVQTRNGEVRVAIEEIDWIEAARDYVLLHTPARSHILRATMAAMEARFGSTDLIRVHRSAMVRPARVTRIDRLSKWQVSLIMADGVAVAVGPNYVRAALAAVRAQGGAAPNASD
ncbi:Transcriptional regulatory protein YehT [compost metagenome]